MQCARKFEVSCMQQQGRLLLLPDQSRTSMLLRAWHGFSSSLDAEQLWHEYFKYPTLWLDNRSSKCNPNFPDFLRKDTKGVLWIDDWRTPEWVRRALERKEKSLPRMVGGTSGFRNAVCKRWPQLDEVRMIHADMIQMGHDLRPHEANALIDMYVKCGSMVDARLVFDKMLTRNVVSWDVMIMGYAKKEGVMALDLYAQMQQEGVRPSGRSFVGALKACSGLAVWKLGENVDDEDLLKNRWLEKGRAIHSQVVENGFESDVFVGTSLVDMYAKCGSMKDAHHVFERLPRRDVVAWTALILGYAENGEGEVALESYARMLQEGVAPNAWTFASALKACSSLTDVEELMVDFGQSVKRACLQKGKAMHSKIMDMGFELDAFLGATLVDLYAKCGSMADARQVFDNLPRRDVVSFSAIISGYVGQGESDKAFELYVQMREQGIPPNSWTFLAILKACGSTAALESGRGIHAQICAAGLETSVIVANALIDMYGRCGSMVDAQQVFDALLTREVRTWSALIAGYARQGDSDLVFHLFQKMRDQGIHPNHVTFLSLLTVCNHAGLVDEGHKYFDSMSKQHGILPRIEHYTCMVDLLGRAGRVDAAAEMVKKMPFQPDLAVWSSMLNACRKWKNVEIARGAFTSAVNLDEQYAAPYVLMSNIYANARMWEDVKEVQAMKVNAGAWKQQGQSRWTDSGGMVHTFVVRDTRHPESQNIRAKLKDLSTEIAKGEISSK